MTLPKRLAIALLAGLAFWVSFSGENESRRQLSVDTAFQTPITLAHAPSEIHRRLGCVWSSWRKTNVCDENVDEINAAAKTASARKFNPSKPPVGGPKKTQGGGGHGNQGGGGGGSFKSDNWGLPAIQSAIDTMGWGESNWDAASAASEKRSASGGGGQGGQQQQQQRVVSLQKINEDFRPKKPAAAPLSSSTAAALATPTTPSTKKHKAAAVAASVLRPSHGAKAFESRDKRQVGR
jgi:hypothetical protein